MYLESGSNSNLSYFALPVDTTDCINLQLLYSPHRSSALEALDAGSLFDTCKRLPSIETSWLYQQSVIVEPRNSSCSLVPQMRILAPQKSDGA